MKQTPPSPAQDKFRLLFEHSSDAHLIVVDGAITDCNEAAVKLLKCSSRDEILSLHPAVLSPERQPDGRLSSEKSAEMDAIARNNGFHRFEWVHRKIDGENFPVSVTLNALDLGGKPAMIAVWHDLTEQKKVEEALRRTNQKMRKDLEAAAAVQQSLLPSKTPLIKGVRTSWAFRPCDELGGDNLNIFLLDENHLGFYVLDVVGHGLAASLLSVAVSHFLSPFSEFSFLRRSDASAGAGTSFSKPSEVASRLNQQFSSHPEISQFFTLVYGILNVNSLDFSYVSAGHPYPILLSGENEIPLKGSGFPIGVMPDSVYEDQHLKLQQGDRLYFYSDGVVEAKSSFDDLYGDRRLMNVMHLARGLRLDQSVKEIVRSVESWSAEPGPDDDISIVAFEVSN